MFAMKSRLPIMAMLILSCAPLLRAQSTGALGYWKTPAGSTIRIDRCGANVCLWIAVLAPSVPTTDIHNPDSTLRSRPLCGMEIGSSFTLNDANRASGGTLYDPKSGKTYHGMMTAEGAQLHLRGYVGIPLFGASETWTRVAAPANACPSRAN
jgi:uncharacterized protein (DUF2147 family)